MPVDRIHSLGLAHLGPISSTQPTMKSKSFVAIRNDRRTGNAGRGRCQGRGMTPDERRAFLAGKRQANAPTHTRIVRVLKAA